LATLASTVRRGLVVLLLLALTAAAASAARPKPHVTLITDSVGASLAWDAAAARIFANGLDVDLELRSCRRLTTASCAVSGAAAPETALQTIERLGPRLGPNVVIDVGYNDYPTVYAPGIEQVLDALARAHVQHVFWVTLHASRGAYAETNAAIVAAARRHPDVTVIDWNACAAGHPDWFAPDGVHLTDSGAQGLAACMHAAVLSTLNAQPAIEIDLVFPEGISTGFHVRLAAHGGTAPYRFSVRGLPRGLRLRRGGAITGTLAATGRFRLRVTVRDARGRMATETVPLDVSR
jgi:hypothetical protein